jgi:hypothetical protein
MDATALWHISDAVIAVVAGGVAGAVATRVFVEPYKASTQERLAHVESNLTNERNERQALRDQIQSQEAKRFDLLHEWRAKAMADTFAALCDLDDAHDAFSGSYAGFVDGPTPKSYWEDFAKAGKVFREAFWSKRILFDSGLAADLMSLNRAYGEISNTFWAKFGAESGALRGATNAEEKRRRIEYDVLSEILHSERYSKLTATIVVLQREIEERFRSLFGVS